MSSYPLFLSVKNNDITKPMSRQAFYKIFRKHYNKNGWERFTPHSARATFITNALKKGCPITDVQHTVGHKQTRTTQMYDKRNKKMENSASFSIEY